MAPLLDVDGDRSGGTGGAGNREDGALYAALGNFDAAGATADRAIDHLDGAQVVLLQPE